jgi:hypothetical protein
MADVGYGRSGKRASRPFAPAARRVESVRDGSNQPNGTPAGRGSKRRTRAPDAASRDSNACVLRPEYVFNVKTPRVPLKVDDAFQVA